jgi:diaminohydroxyphosphoribosylaminopyrimidine deaminase / 5-amino-6-(5-phosphoribosylamino)uracil reductase
MSHSLTDTHWMQQALALASQALYLTSPNPRVGCVLVKNGEEIGQGHTQAAGSAHAEVMALQNARQRGNDTHGATAYVTLEPCSHQGRTGPCSDALIDAGISRVVAAVQDPNPLVSGKGLEKLRSAGVDVSCGLLAEQAHEINIGFFQRMTLGRPWVRMKIAMSLDGQSALENGASQWITEQAARDDGHHWRARACAVLTGIGTVKQDNPLLNVRAVSTPRQPTLIIVDSQLETPVDARLFDIKRPTWIYAAKTNARADHLAQRGAQISALDNNSGKIDLTAMINDLGRRGVNELHIEAGHKLNGSFLRENLVDELLVYVAPKLIGQGQRIANLGPFESLLQAKLFAFQEIKPMGPDLRLILRRAQATN